MNEERINQIKDRVRDLIERMMAMGEEPPPEIRDLLSQVIQRAQQQVNELRAQEQQQQPPQEPPQQPPAAPRVAPPPHYDSRLLWILSGRNPEAFTQYLQTYPTAGTANLLANPDLLNSTIQQLSTSMPPGQNEALVEGGIPHADLQSSNIWGALYDQKTGKMKVRFQGGSEYEYDGIPKNIFNAFIHGQASAKTKGENQYGKWWPQKNPSLGASFNQYIKEGNFAYRKIR